MADAARLRHVAEIITDTYKAGNQVVAVLSAQGDTTDELIEKANEINPLASNREMDMLLSTGEQMSVALCAMAVEALGYPVISLTGWQAGMVTNTVARNARIKKVDTERIETELNQKKIVIVTGFQGINRYEDITTLGRGGSDTSAVALAASLRADLCQIYTDVDGVYTADPRIVKDARKLDEVTYNEMLELATLGAQVLHNRSVEMAKRYGVKLVVLSSLTRAEGTIIKEKTSMEKMLVSGVAADKNTARISVLGVKDEPGIAFRLFNLLARYRINVDIIIQSVGRDNRKDISFTVARTDLQETMKIINDHLEMLTADSVSADDTVAKISIIGAGMTSNPGVAAKMFEALSGANINIKMIATSEIRITVLIDEEDASRAMRVVHDAFSLAD